MPKVKPKKSTRYTFRDTSENPYDRNNIGASPEAKSNSSNGFNGRVFPSKHLEKVRIITSDISPDKEKKFRKRPTSSQSLAITSLAFEFQTREAPTPESLFRAKSQELSSGSDSDDSLSFLASPLFRLETNRPGEGQKVRTMFIESELNLKDEKVIDSLIKTSHKTTPKKPKIAPKRKRLEAEKKQTSEKICLSSSSGNISKILPRGHTKIKKQRTAVSKKLVTSPREHIQAELKFTQETIDYLVQPEIKQQIKAAIKCDWDTLPAKDKRKIFTLKLIKRPDINAFITAHFFNNGEITLNNTTVKIILLKLYESYETLHKIAHSLIKEDGEANLFLGPKLLNSNMCIGEAIGRKLNKRFKVKATTKVTHPEKTESPKNFSPRAEGVVSMHYELDSVKTKLSFLMPAQPLRSACFPAGCAASIVESLLTPYLNGASGSGNSIMSDSDIEEDTCSETSNITASEGDDEASIASNSSACS